MDLFTNIEERSVTTCGQKLIEKGLTIAFAESATGGRMAAEFSLVKNSGKFLKGGLTCYDACLKESVLHVPSKMIEEFTPESTEVTFAITSGLIGLIKADLHVGVTGLTCPGGSETEDKPVGTMFLCCLFGENKVFEERIVFKGNPEAIVLQTVHYAANLIERFLDGFGNEAT